MLRSLTVVTIALLAGLTGANADPAYVGSEACVDCHGEAAEAWRGSHHALAWTEPSPDTVIADFDGTEFALDAMSARFRRDDGGYHATVTEADGTTADYTVHSVVGVEPLQQYLFETEPGRLQSFDVVWDTEKGGWFHLYPDQDLATGDGLHWTGPYKTWNARCAECHATGFEKVYDAATRSYASTQAEIGVGCEACHGPGSAHLDWAEGSQTDDQGGLGLTVDLGEPAALVAQCATCHSRREAWGDGNPVPGTPYNDSYNLALLRPGLYHADGQILDEVFVYGSFLQSRMHDRGVTCSDCHEPHSADLVADGNAVCTQCHSPAGNPRFPTLTPAAYDAVEHHFHEPGTDGAQCKSCHMIERVYMGNDGRRDHSFRVPRPDLADATGGPDACTDCHADRDPDWAASRIAEWYPESGNRGAHYGEVLARGRDNAVSAAGDLAGLAADPGEPAIVRATALWLLRQANSPLTAERLAPLLADPDPIVRAAAVGLQQSADPQDRVLRLIGLLDDEVRTVRIAAARELLGSPIAHMPGTIAVDLDAAMGEWREGLSNRLDFPETQLQLAGMALTARAFPAAVGAFREAVRLDPQLVDAWIMLVRIAAAAEGPAAARAVVDAALAANPQAPELRAMERELSAAP
jgi:predicted CXXCH cytochrome family protein